MSVKIGVSPISWTNDDLPELGGDTTVEHCLQEGRQAGYRGFELGGKWPREVSVLEPLFSKYGMDVVSSWFCGGLLKDTIEAEIKRITPHMQLLKDLGTDVIVYCEMDSCVHGDITSPLSKRPTLDDDQWKEWTEKLDQLAKYTLSHGMKLAYHHHMGTVIETENETRRLIENTKDTVKLLIDTGHMLFAQGNSIKLAEDFCERLIHVHCKDIRKDILEKSLKNDSTFRQAFLDGAFTVPGDGCIDYKPFLKVLHKKKYKGWLVVEAEQDPAKANPFEYAKIGFNYLSKTAKECGLEIIN